ncbi:MAG: hypothetical protein GTN99_02800 [Candidatus Dadabacteria bacterium]|nr:hypothetical protein [Candidatus Dadabacteria bacterium]
MILHSDSMVFGFRPVFDVHQSIVGDRHNMVQVPLLMVPVPVFVPIIE